MLYENINDMSGDEAAASYSQSVLDICKSRDAALTSNENPTHDCCLVSMEGGGSGET